MQATPTAHKPRTNRRNHVAGSTYTALPYPDACAQSEVNPRLFYLAHWMCAAAEQEAFQAFLQSAPVRNKRRGSHVLGMAIAGAAIALEDHEDELAAKLRDNGGILFAWAGTNALSQGGAA